MCKHHGPDCIESQTTCVRCFDDQVNETHTQERTNPSGLTQANLDWMCSPVNDFSNNHRRDQSFLREQAPQNEQKSWVSYHTRKAAQYERFKKLNSQQWQPSSYNHRKHSSSEEGEDSGAGGIGASRQLEFETLTKKLLQASSRPSPNGSSPKPPLNVEVMSQVTKKKPGLWQADVESKSAEERGSESLQRDYTLVDYPPDAFEVLEAQTPIINPEARHQAVETDEDDLWVMV